MLDSKHKVVVKYNALSICLSEGGCYGYISNIGDTLINKHIQFTVYSITNKCHAYSSLECTTIVDINISTYM